MNESLPLHILLQQHNERALTVLDNDHAEGLFRALRYRGYLVNEADFDEIFNASLHRIWDLRTTFNTTADVVKTLYKITKEKAIDELRRRNTLAKRLLTGVEPGDLEADRLTETISHQEMPIWQTRLRLFRSAMKQLTERQREVMQLLVFEGKSPEEVGDQLQIAYTTVTNTRVRALGKMKENLLQNNITPDMVDQLSQLLTVVWLLLSTFLKNS